MGMRLDHVERFAPLTGVGMMNVLEIELDVSPDPAGKSLAPFTGSSLIN